MAQKSQAKKSKSKPQAQTTPPETAGRENKGAEETNHQAESLLGQIPDVSLQAQANALYDPRLHTRQRQGKAIQIGKRYGNIHLQRVIQKGVHLNVTKKSAVPLVQRETAEEIKARFMNWGGLNLQEEALASHLLGLVRAGNYALVTQVITVLDWVDRDDVAGEMMPSLTNEELIHIARNDSGREMLQRMKAELQDWWGWITREERHQGELLAAVLDEPGARALWNRQEIGRIKTAAGSDLEALAQIFESSLVIDDGTVTSRLQAVLAATEHLLIPGLQTGIDFQDTGFAGDQEPGGQGFRDPHPSSRNQVGHFLTAVGLQFSPAVVSRQIPIFGTIRQMVQAPANMDDQEVALRLTIGHEKAPDPDGTMAAISIALRGVGESLRPGPEGETEDERDERVGRAIADETRRQIEAIIQAFRTQFQATTDDDIRAWNEAITALGTGNELNLAAAEAPLSRIAINNANRGNSIQDMRLSLVGWRLGQLIGSGAFGEDRTAVASWIRANLGPR